MSLPEEPRRRPTIMDVARVAGVSHQTVSRVLNGNGPVAAATKSRVESAMVDLGYSPSPAAQALASGRLLTIGVLAIGTDQYGPRRMLAEIETEARRDGYQVSVVDLPDERPDGITDAIDAISGTVAGLVVLAPVELPRDLLDRIGAGVPVVLVDATPGSPYPSTSIDQIEGARLAVDHLHSLGHRRVALVAGPQDWHDASQRIAGWVSESTTRGLHVVGSATGDWSAASGAAATRSLLDDGVFEGPARATAVLCGNDSMAVGVLHELHREGIDVPDEVSVVGFDDLPEAAFLIPALTTIRQDFGALARGCVRQLLGSIAVPGAPATQEMIVPTLVVRSSTSPAR